MGNILNSMLNAVALQSLIGPITFPGVISYREKLFRFTKRFIKNTVNHRESTLQAQLKTKEQALKNISQELHDNIGNVLTLIKLNLSSIRISNDAPATGKIHQSIALLERAVNDLRDLTRAVQPGHMDKAGLAAVLQKDIDFIRKSGLISVFLKVEGTEVRLGIAREIVIYRMLQEVLSNILKHANATDITLHFLYSQKNFEITIKDNGKGFNRDIIGRGNYQGAGLNNLFSRAQLIGGAIYIDTAPGCGTTICFSMPVQIGIGN